MLCVYATCMVKPQYVDSFLTLANTLIDASRNEAGNVAYHLCQSKENQYHYAFVEQWKDQLAMDLHLNAEHFRVLLPRISALLEQEMEIHKMEILK